MHMWLRLAFAQVGVEHISHPLIKSVVSNTGSIMANARTCWPKANNACAHAISLQLIKPLAMLMGSGLTLLLAIKG